MQKFSTKLLNLDQHHSPKLGLCIPQKQVNVKKEIGTGAEIYHFLIDNVINFMKTLKKKFFHTKKTKK